MRLMGADALIEEMVKVPGNRWNTKTLGEALDSVPTIDAIPVEWLRKEMNMADDRGDVEMTDAISWLIQTWHKEQEVDDG